MSKAAYGHWMGIGGKVRNVNAELTEIMKSVGEGGVLKAIASDCGLVRTALSEANHKPTKEVIQPIAQLAIAISVYLAHHEVCREIMLNELDSWVAELKPKTEPMPDLNMMDLL